MTMLHDAASLDLLRAEYDVIPFVLELSADTITPVAAFAAIATLSKDVFLFESVERGESVGRYSFIGFSPRRSLVFHRDSIDPAGTLRRELEPLKVYGEEKLPPFFGGAVGYFTYAVSGWNEKIPDTHPGASIPDAHVVFFDDVIAFDHVRQRLLVVVNVFAADTRSSRELVVEATRRLDRAEAALRNAVVDVHRVQTEDVEVEWRSEQTREEFESIVRRAKEEIAAGEIFQIVLSQRWSAPFEQSDALPLYRELRSINPSPYMFFLRSGGVTLVGTSPEMLVRVTHGNVETRPIAGTRRRGETPERDRALAEELLADAKENAEHLMLVDLGRNDLGRVCDRGTVEVSEFRKIERYSHVMHIVSGVKGKLQADRTPIDAFFSAFPAGTVSGAPKIRAMQLIDQLEPSRRGPYAGAVAYIGFSGNLDSCIAIRTVVLANGKAYVQAGAGIVHDSEPSLEYDETVNKAAALKRAVSAVAASRTNAAEGVS
jgi:anthranilate synthase component I